MKPNFFFHQKYIIIDIKNSHLCLFHKCLDKCSKKLRENININSKLFMPLKVKISRKSDKE
jgi:hypothetical protein